MIPFILIYHHKHAQRSSWLSNTPRKWNLKKYAKSVLFKADFAVFWAPKAVVEATTWVQNTLDGGQTCLIII